MKPFVHRSVLALTTVLTLSGCGGGGGSTSSSSSNTYTTPVAINSSNAIPIAASVISGGSMAQGFTSVPTAISSTSNQTTHTPGYRFILDKTLNSARRAISSTKSSISAPTGVLNTVSSGTCPAGGSYSTVWNDANNSTVLDGGDTLTIVDNQCTDTSTYTDINNVTVTTTYVSNGTTIFTITDLTGDPAVSSADWSMGFTFSTNTTYSMSATDGTSYSFSTQGGATLTASYNATTLVNSTSMTGSSLMETASSGPYLFSIELADFNFAQGTDNTYNTYTLDIDYTLRSSEIGGSVTVVTNPVFSGAVGYPPDTGRMVITGANGTQIVVEAAGGDNATVTVNGGAPQTVSWTSSLGWGA